MTEDKKRVVEESWFTLDVGPVLKGYHEYWVRWNGWACPSFAKSETQRLMDWMNDSADTKSASWDEDTVCIRQVDGEDERYEKATLNIVGWKQDVWHVGSHSWCWNDIESPSPGQILAICQNNVEHDTFVSTAFVKEVLTLTAHGQPLSSTRGMRHFDGGLHVDPAAGHAVVFPSDRWRCDACGETAVVIQGRFPSDLTAEQQDDIDGVLWGKVDNSHDAGGLTMEAHEAAAAVIYDCVHYFSGVLEDACLDDPEKQARWPDDANELEELRLQVVDYVRRKYFGLFNDSLLPR